MDILPGEIILPSVDPIASHSCTGSELVIKPDKKVIYISVGYVCSERRSSRQTDAIKDMKINDDRRIKQPEEHNMGSE